jgi:hypothetical protein
MRVRGCTVEYDLNEAAKMLEISSDDLKCGVEDGVFRYYYSLESGGYCFHEASLCANRELLAGYNQYRHRRDRPAGVPPFPFLL